MTLNSSIPSNPDNFDSEIYKGFTQGEITVLGKAEVSGFTVRCSCGTFSCRERDELKGNSNDACLECSQQRLEIKSKSTEQ